VRLSSCIGSSPSWTGRGWRWYTRKVASATGWTNLAARFLLGRVLILTIIRLSR